jgi:hypothetical protein
MGKAVTFARRRATQGARMLSSIVRTGSATREDFRALAAACLASASLNFVRPRVGQQSAALVDAGRLDVFLGDQVSEDHRNRKYGDRGHLAFDGDNCKVIRSWPRRDVQQCFDAAGHAPPVAAGAYWTGRGGHRTSYGLGTTAAKRAPARVFADTRKALTKNAIIGTGGGCGTRGELWDCHGDANTYWYSPERRSSRSEALVTA